MQEQRYGSNQMSINRQTDKEDAVHVYNGILLIHKKWSNANCSNMDGPRDNHVKWGKSEKDKYHIIHLCTEPKKKKWFN